MIPEVVSFFQAGVLFCKENAKFWCKFTLFLVCFYRHI